MATRSLFSTFTALMLMAGTSAAVEPLSEDAMGDLALESGNVVLQIYGATAAGLSIEREGDDQTDTSTNEDDTDDTAIESAKATIKNLEDQLTEEFEKNSNGLAIDPNLDAIFKPKENVVGQAEVFDTKSEIQYDKEKFKHEAAFNDDGSVQHDRDLQIDLLKFENIGTDDLNDARFGSIYISDWSSQGSTTTQVRDQ